MKRNVHKYFSIKYTLKRNSLLKMKKHTLENVIDKILILGHASGLLKIKRINNNYKNSILWQGYSIILKVVLIPLSLYVLYRNTTNNNSKSNIINFGNKLFVYSNIGSSTVFLILIPSKKFVNIFDSLHEISNELSSSSLELTYEKMYFYFNYQIVLAIWLCVIVSAIISYTNISFTIWFTNFSSSFVIFSSVTIYINTLILLYQLYDRIMKSLEICRGVGFLRVLIKSHIGLCEAASCLNNIFALPMTHFVLVIFVVNLFTAFRNIKVLYTSPEEDIFEILCGTIWAIYLTGLFVGLLVTCSTVCKLVRAFLMFYFHCALYFYPTPFHILVSFENLCERRILYSYSYSIVPIKT